MRPRHLYHGTSVARLESILAYGLGGRHSVVRPGFVHLAGDILHASAYAHHWSEGDGVVLRVDVGLLDRAALGPDREDLQELLGETGRSWRDIGWLESLKLSGQCVYGKIIPATNLTITRFCPERGKACDLEASIADWLHVRAAREAPARARP